MTYTYAYKTSDGQRHEATIEAPSREVVFAELRAQGIKAIKVVAADGSKANGAPSTQHPAPSTKIFVLGALCLVLGAAVAIVFAFRAGESSSLAPGTQHQAPGTTFLTDTTRRQVIGDAAIIEKGIRTGWADVFEHEGDRFLASFAIPGVKAGVGTTSIAALEEVLAPDTCPHALVGTYPPNALVGTAFHRRPPLPATSNNCGGRWNARPTGGHVACPHASPTTARDGRATSMKSPLGIEAQQIIAMVEGMKREARAYLAAGGTVVEYGKRLTERQDAEIAVYKRAEAEILAAYKQVQAPGTNPQAPGTQHQAPSTSPAPSTQHPAPSTKHQAPSIISEADFTKFYEQRNDELRNLGLRPVILPE